MKFKTVALLAIVFSACFGGSNLSPTGDITAVTPTTGGGLTGGATVGSASLGLLTSCASNEILKWSGSAWACSADAGAGTGITNSAGNNVVMKSNGTNAVASQATDDGTTFAVPNQFSLTDLRLDNAISPTLTGTSTNDWNPAGFSTATMIRVTTPTARHVLTGMQSMPAGTIRIIQNHGDGVGIFGTSPLVLSYRNTNSVIANRFIGPGMTDLTLKYADVAICYYDGGAGGWMVIGVATSNDGRQDLVRTSDLQLAPQLSPSALASGDTSDYAPTGYDTTMVWRLTANASGSTLTGIAPPAAPSWWTTTPVPSERKWGSMRLITNVGSGVLTLANERTSSAANQFNLPGARDFGIASLDSVIVVYDETASRWKLYAGRNAYTQVDTLSFRGTITDTLASGNTDNYNPSGLGTTTVLRIIPNAGGSTLTGIVAQEGNRILKLEAFGSTLTLKHQGGTSGAANRFYLPAGTDMTLSLGQVVELIYDVGNTSWMVLGGGSAAAGVTSVATTAPIAGGTITGTGTLSLTTCSANQIYKMSGGVWTCSADATGSGITNSAGANVVMKSDGTNAVASTISDNGSTATFSGNLTSIAGSTSIGGTYGTVISPASISGTTNDWNPTSFSTALVIRVTTSATTNITGLAGAIDGHLLTLVNVSASTLTLSNETTSTAANRINTGTGADITLAQNQSASLVYDGTTARWRVIGPVYSASTGLSLSAANAFSLNITGATCGTNTVMTALGATGTGTCAAPPTFTSGAAGYVPASGGGTTNFLRADGTFAAPGGGGGITNSAGNNVVTKSDGTNVVASQITDDGTTVTISGKTKVGSFTGTIASVTLTSGVLADWSPTGLSTATIVQVTSASGLNEVTGISASGSAAGRILIVDNHSGQSMTFYNENAGSAAGNKLKTTNAVTRTVGNYGSITFVYDGTYWLQVAEETRYAPELYSLGSLFVTAASDLIGTVSTYGNTVIGDASGDTLTVNATSTMVAPFSTSGTATLGDSGTADKVIIKGGEFADGGTAPSAGTCGTTPTYAGGRNAFRVTAGTTAPTTCAVTFSTAFDATPICVVTAQGTSKAVYITALSTSAITFSNTGADSMQGITYNVICVGDG